MTVYLLCLLQAGGGEASPPDIGVRISIWFIGMFLLAVGGAILYFRIKELGEERKRGKT